MSINIITKDIMKKLPIDINKYDLVINSWDLGTNDPKGNWLEGNIQFTLVEKE